MPVPFPFLGGFLYRQLLITPPMPRTRFDDKTIIVTGSNVGLGLEAARHFGRLGAARIILAVRDLKKGEAAKKSIDQTLSRSPSPVTVWKLDLSSYDSVQEFAARVYKELDRVDAVCENAGIATGIFRLTERDESTITTNVVSTFLLAFLLLPKLKETAQRFNTLPTLTITSSEVVRPCLVSQPSAHLLINRLHVPSYSTTSLPFRSETSQTSSVRFLIGLKRTCAIATT
jgi:NAD(P)-dependent dehydrogenase (short-subunit alcohol dehydrogenase family)